MTPEPSLVEVSDEPLSPNRSSSVSESEDEFEYASTETTAPLIFLNAFVQVGQKLLPDDLMLQVSFCKQKHARWAE